MSSNSSDLWDFMQFDDPIHRPPILRCLKPRSPKLESMLEYLFFTLLQSATTDVALVHSDGTVLKVHQLALHLSGVMKRRLQEAEAGSRLNRYIDQHLRIDLPETIELYPTVQVIFLLYLGQTSYSEGKPMTDALTWFGISRVQILNEGQELFEDLYKLEPMRKEYFNVRYTINGRNYLMDVEGLSRCKFYHHEAPSAQANSTVEPCSSINYCFSCLLVFKRNQDKRHYGCRCVDSKGQGIVGNLHTDVCKINNCGMIFVQAPSLTEGIYHHTAIVHQILQYQAYVLHPHPVCLVCSWKKGTLNHCVESPGEFLLNVFQCYQAEQKKLKRRISLTTYRPPNATAERDLIDLNSSIWYRQLRIRRA